MAALKQMGDNDLKELGIPMVFSVLVRNLVLVEILALPLVFLVIFSSDGLPMFIYELIFSINVLKFFAFYEKLYAMNNVCPLELSKQTLSTPCFFLYQYRCQEYIAVE